MVIIGFAVASDARLRTLVSEIAPWVKSMREQLAEVDAFRREGRRGTVFVNLALSAHGMRKLGLRAPPDAAFAAGMKERSDAFLRDPPVAAWELPYRQNFDAVVVIGAATRTAANRRARSVRRLLNDDEVIVVERGHEIAQTINGRRTAVEHFGFADGISQPVYIDDGSPPGLGWGDHAPLSTILVREAPEDATEATYGSFMVFRKLEQDTAAFAAHEALIASRLAASPGSQLDPGALLVGRHRNGTPLATSPTQSPPLQTTPSTTSPIQPEIDAPSSRTSGK